MFTRAFTLSLLLLLSAGLALNSTTRYSCYDDSTLLKNVSYSDGSWDAEYLPCEFGCYDGACADKTLSVKGNLSWLFFAASVFFLAIFVVLKNDVFGIFSFVLAIGTVSLALFVFASPAAPDTVLSLGMGMARALFWVGVAFMLLVVARAVFNLVLNSFGGGRRL